MNTRKPYQGLQRKLVLAFDVGTTYSGVSYSILDPGLVPVIQGVTRYPANEHVGGDSKIPSIMYYDQQGTVRAVGAEATQEGIIERAEDEDWIRVEWFKLYLRPKGLASSHISDQDLPPLPKNITPIRAFADFLRYLYQCASAYIQTTHASGAELWKSVQGHTEFVLSHPNGWEGAQQNQIRQAAVLAGLIPDDRAGHAQIQLVTEGEASLHFCVRNGLATDAMKTDQGIMIVDAGGGTVDLSSYFMTMSPNSFEEIAPTECRLQGSVFVSRRARAYLEDKLRGSKFGGPEDIAHMTQCFNKTTKLSFRNAEEPSYIKFGTARDRDPAVGIRSGQLKLLGSEVATLFQPSIDGIIEAIEKQREAADKPLSACFLCIDFYGDANDRGRLYFWWAGSLQASGSSKNFNHMLNLWGYPFADQTVMNKAVADGGVSFYLDHVVSARIAKFSYGTDCSVPYEAWRPEHKRRSHTVEFRPSGTVVLPSGFSSILAKGTKVSEEKEFRKPYFFECLHASELDSLVTEISCYHGDSEDPRWTDTEPDKFSTLCSISADMSGVAKTSVPLQGRTGSLYYRQDFSIVLLFGLTELKAQVSWMEDGKEQRGPARIVYDGLVDQLA